MAEKLSIYEGLDFDEVITKVEPHAYYPRSNNFGLNDEIRINIQNQDIYTLPSESYIYLEGELSTDDGTGDCVLTNNAYTFLFDQIRYELNSVEVDRCNKPGITSTLKAYISYNDNESKCLQMAGWCPDSDIQPTLTNKKWSANIPLKFVLGFPNDYGKIIINASQELILVRSKTDINCYQNKTGTKKATITINKVEWNVPHISVNDEARLKLLQTLQENNPIYIPFRKFDLYELPSLRTTTTDIWSIKSSTNLERPRYVIVALQTGKRDNVKESAVDFDHCNITNIKLYLNSESYPYDKLNLNFSEGRYTKAYCMYTAFQESFLNRFSQPLLDLNEFKKTTLFVIDCSKQNESLKSATVDIKLELECDSVFPANTLVNAVIVHDQILEYHPLTNIVRKLI